MIYWLHATFIFFSKALSKISSFYIIYYYDTSGKIYQIEKILAKNCHLLDSEELEGRISGQRFPPNRLIND